MQLLLLPWDLESLLSRKAKIGKLDIRPAQIIVWHPVDSWLTCEDQAGFENLSWLTSNFLDRRY